MKLFTWKDLEMISSWKATWFRQLQQLYNLGPTKSAIEDNKHRHRHRPAYRYPKLRLQKGCENTKIISVQPKFYEI